MRPPEMAYSPAYHQAQGSLGPVPKSILAPHSRRSLESPEQAHPAPLRPSDEWTPAGDVSPRSSGLRGSYAYSPETSRRQSRVEDGAPATRILLSSSGATYKEARSSSWADQPSVMSAEQPATPRARKRDGPEYERADDGQDALLMLVSPPPLSKHRHGLSDHLVVPPLSPRPDILALRQPLHLLRALLRNPLLPSASLLNISLSPQHELQ